MVLVVTLLRMIIVCISMDKSCRLAKEEGSSSFPSGAAGSCATQLVRAAMFCPSVHRQDRRCAELSYKIDKIERIDRIDKIDRIDPDLSILSILSIQSIL